MGVDEEDWVRTEIIVRGFWDGRREEERGGAYIEVLLTGGRDVDRANSEHVLFLIGHEHRVQGSDSHSHSLSAGGEGEFKA